MTHRGKKVDAHQTSLLTQSAEGKQVFPRDRSRQVSTMFEPFRLSRLALGDITGIQGGIRTARTYHALPPSQKWSLLGLFRTA